MEKNFLQDPVFEKVNEITKRDNAKAEEAVDLIVKVLKDKLDNDKEFSTKHGFLALGRCLVYLTQTFCKDNDHFNAELEKANSLAVDKMMASLMPLMKDGKIVEENFDMEDVSLRRVLMALGCAIDYTFWRNELSQYASMRNEIEEEEATETKETTES